MQIDKNESVLLILIIKFNVDFCVGNHFGIQILKSIKIKFNKNIKNRGIFTLCRIYQRRDWARHE